VGLGKMVLVGLEARGEPGLPDAPPLGLKGAVAAADAGLVSARG